MDVVSTPIPGLLVVRVPVHGDTRGWFKENWHREKMSELGLPDFEPVQNNVSYNASRGATRGIHAEPWDKFISVVHGRVFSAWVDLRAGDTFGQTFTLECDPGVAVFVPRGVGNSYQALDDDTVYSYLVTEHWTPDQAYPAVNLADDTLAIPWPIPLDAAEVSPKDRDNPDLADVTPMEGRRTLILGTGQVGCALAEEFPDARVVGRDELDLTDPKAMEAWPWDDYDVVMNAAAFSDVDGAETPEGRVAAWSANATGVARLAEVARRHRFTLVHFSTDYVYAGTAAEASEDEPLAPASAYAQSKAAGDLAVGCLPRHLILRTAWVVGDGHNFVDTMSSLAERGVSPEVVDDQIGRLTFVSTLVAATRHLLDAGAESGVYHVTNGGEPASWCEIAARVFEASGRSRDDVTPTSTDDYAAGVMAAGRRYAPRPQRSVLSLDKLRASGFEPEDHLTLLERYLNDGG